MNKANSFIIARRAIAAAIASMVVTASAADSPASAAATSVPTGLDEVLMVAPGPKQSDDSNALALSAVREVGLSYGTRAGLAYESAQIARYLETRANVLDRLDNFQPLMMPGNVVPPVLVETRQTYDEKSPDHVVLADMVYRVEKHARFSSVAPDWRSYVMRAYTFNKDDTGGWKPRSADELAMWQAAVKEGWQAGVEQAHQILKANFARLTRDIVGMLNYRQLYARNMVTAPTVSKVTMGVTGGGDEMNINEATLVIRERSALKASPSEWKMRGK